MHSGCLLRRRRRRRTTLHFFPNCQLAKYRGYISKKSGVITISYLSLLAPPRCIAVALPPCHPISPLVTLLKAPFDTAADDRSIGCNTLAPLRTSDPLIPLITSYNFAEGRGCCCCCWAPDQAGRGSADLMGHLASHFSANGIAWKGNKKAVSARTRIPFDSSIGGRGNRAKRGLLLEWL